MSEYAVSLEALHVVDALPAVIFDCDADSTREKKIHPGWMRATVASLGGRVHYEDSSSLRFRAGSYPNGEPLILYFYRANRAAKSDAYEFALSDRRGLEEWVSWNMGPSYVPRIFAIARSLGFRVPSGTITLLTSVESARDDATRYAEMIARCIEILKQPPEKPPVRFCDHSFKVHKDRVYGYKCPECNEIQRLRRKAKDAERKRARYAMNAAS